MKQSLETCDYYTVSIETKGYSWNSFGRKENEMLIIQQFYSNSISLLKSQEFTGLTLSTHLFIIKIDTQGTLYFLPFIFRDFCWWQWRQHWGWGRWIRRTFFSQMMRSFNHSQKITAASWEEGQWGLQFTFLSRLSPHISIIVQPWIQYVYYILWEMIYNYLWPENSPTAWFPGF